MAHYGQRAQAPTIPPNTYDCLYFARDDCCKYSSLRFDEQLANGRITRFEVDNFLRDLHQKVGSGFSKRTCCCCVLYLILMFFCFFVLSLVLGTKVDGMQDPSALIYLFVAVVLISTLLLICCCCMNNGRFQKKLRIYLGEMNTSVYNARGLHWSVGEHLNYLQLVMNYGQQ